jgi:hypothetical protein
MAQNNLPDAPCGASLLPARGWQDRFLRIASAVLLTTGGAKLVSAWSAAKVMEVPDPMFGIPFRYLLLLAALAELSVALACMRGGRQPLSFCLLAWLAGSISIYRGGLWAIGWQTPCGCLGSLTAALGISTYTADWLMEGLLGFLLVGSCCGLVAQANTSKNTQTK